MTLGRGWTKSGHGYKSTPATRAAGRGVSGAQALANLRASTPTTTGAAVVTKANKPGGHKVSAEEYVAKHTSSFGGTETESLQQGLNNLFTGHTVIGSSEKINVVQNENTNTIDVYTPEGYTLTEKEKKDIKDLVDKIGDTPNNVYFMRGEQGLPGIPGMPGEKGEPGLPGISIKGDTGEEGGQGVRGATGAPAKISTGVMLLIAGVLTVLYFIFRRK